MFNLCMYGSLFALFLCVWPCMIVFMPLCNTSFLNVCMYGSIFAYMYVILYVWLYESLKVTLYFYVYL